MKKLIFVFVLAFALMSFTSSTKDGTNLKIIDKIQVENLMNEDVPCKWRTCTYSVQNGIATLIGCTEWEYGECVRNSDGVLEIQ